MNLSKRSKKGFALIFVLLIAALMMIPVLVLLSSVTPRRTTVTTEALSDQVLALGDATVDKVLSQINAFPSVVTTDSTLRNGFDSIAAYYTDHPVLSDPNYVVAKTVIYKYSIAYLLSTLNGGTVFPVSSTTDPRSGLQAGADTYADALPATAGSVWDIEDNVSTYLYDLKERAYYAVVTDTGSNAKVAAVSSVGMSGDFLTKPIKNLSSGQIKAGISAWDAAYATDNRWVEIDTNTQYEDDGSNDPMSTKFGIRVSAYHITSSGTRYVARNILAEATLHSLGVSLGTSTSSGPFDKALWSGKGLKIDGNITVAEAEDYLHALASDYVPGGGDVYAEGIINAKAGQVTIGGSLITSEPPAADPKDDPIVLNGSASVGGRVYDQDETLPDFPTGTEASAMGVAKAATGPYTPGNLTCKNTTLFVNGVDVDYYIDGDVDISNSTVNFAAIPAATPVDWYVNGDLTLDGTTLNLGANPGIIWVNGDITFKSGTGVAGQGTIVANGKITFEGKSAGLAYLDPTSIVAIISEGEGSLGGIDIQGNQNFCGLFYAPHSDIVKGGNGTVFGSLVAEGSVSSGKNGITLNGAKNTFVYDPRWGEYSGPLPSQLTVEGVAFPGSPIYRFSWREMISKPVTEPNIQTLNPEFIFSN